MSLDETDQTLSRVLRNFELKLESKQNLISLLKEKAENKDYEIDKLHHLLSKSDRRYNQVKRYLTVYADSFSYKLGCIITAPLRLMFDSICGRKFRMYPLEDFLHKVVDSNHEAYTLDSSDHEQGIQYEIHEDGSGKGHENIGGQRAVPILDILPFDSTKLGSVLFIAPHLPDYDTSSGGKRAARMLKLLQKNYNVYAFATDGLVKKYAEYMTSIGVHVVNTRIPDQAQKILPEIQYIIYAWYYSYFDTEVFTRIYPNAVVIADTVDVHWVREERSIGLMEGLTEQTVAQNKKKELRVYSQATIIWTVTEEDKDQVLKELPNADVRVVSNIHEAHQEDYNAVVKDNTILFFGGYKHYPNISAVKFLCEEVLPKVREEIPDAEVLVAGANAPKEIRDLGHLEGVTFLGFIEERDVGDLYNRSRIVAAPLTAGAGIKGKICEAIVHRVPVVTNDIGNEGINLVHLEDGFVVSSLDSFTQEVIRALRSSDEYEKMTKKALDRLMAKVGPDHVLEQMEASLLPEISICIVTWNRIDFIKRCLDSLLKYTKYPRFRVLVHSNGCSDGTQEYLREMGTKHEQIEPILCTENLVFVKPNNQMMEMYPTSDVVLLNNDTEVTEGWLYGLWRAAYSGFGVGASGAKLLYPDGSLQEFGSELYADGTGRNIGKHDDPRKAQYNRMKEVGYVSGCALYMKRKSLDLIGGFDEQFHPCYCEDSDWCYTAKEHGLKTLVTHESVVYHFEGGTSGTDVTKGFKSYQKVNMKKFMDKHRYKSNGINWMMDSEQL